MNGGKNKSVAFIILFSVETVFVESVGNDFITGLYTLYSCIANKYHFVNNRKSWTEAQSYCREHYSDLATIDNMEDMETLVNTVISGHKRSIWIGLYNDINSWSWSDQSKSAFRYWLSGKPDNRYNTCVSMSNYYGKWEDYPCETQLPFSCYSGELYIVRN
uniref:C-type lectin domain-containing protein n=1 Tax=Esox lucius TaxID=8010 RepID=A0A3P8XWY4_ESOLU